MNQKETHKHIHKITLNEKKVAQFLFDLLQANFMLPKTQNATVATAPAVTENPYAQLKQTTQGFYDFVHRLQKGDVDEKKIEVRLMECMNQIDNAASVPVSVWDVAKTLFSIGADALDLNLAIAALSDEETRGRAIRLFQWLVKFSFLIPFENFSLEKIAENKFEKLIGELTSEMDSFKDKNYDIGFNMIMGFLTSVTIVVSVVAYKFQNSGVTWFFQGLMGQPFYYWVFVVIGYAGVTLLVLTLQNLYEQKKRAYLIDMLDSMKNPLTNPELITHEYLLFIRDALVKFRELWPEEVEAKEYAKTLRQLSLVFELRFGNRLKGWILVGFEIVKSNWLPIALSTLYFLLFYVIQAYPSLPW